LEFSSTAMSLCGLMCRVRCPDVLLCYDSSAASDAQCPILCFIRWLCHYCNATLAGLSASQLSRLQSVLNAAARLIHRSSRYEHVTPMLRDLHWLRSPECIDLKLAVLTYRYLHGLAPRYLSDYIQSVAVSNCRRLRSLSSSQLVIRRTRLSTVGDRAFPVAWKSATRRHLSFNAVCFSKPPQNFSFPDHFLPNCFRFLVLHTVYSSGLAVLVL